MSDERRMAAYSLDGLILQWPGQKSNHVCDKVFDSLGLTYHPFQWKNESVSINYNKTIEGVYRDFLSTSDLLGLGPKLPRIGSNAKLYLLRQVFSQTRKKLSLR